MIQTMNDYKFMALGNQSPEKKPERITVARQEVERVASPRSLNGRELSAYEYICGIQLLLETETFQKPAKTLLKDRPALFVKLMQCGHDFAEIVRELEKLTDEKVQRHMDNLMRDCKFGFKMRNISDNMACVDCEDVSVLINAAMAAECSMCMKEGAEAGMCRLRKAMMNLAPPNAVSGFGCPYQNVARDSMYGQYIDEQKHDDFHE